MTTNPALGILLHAIGGFAAGSFYAPLKKVERWAWESFWLVMGLAAWLAAPWIVALITIPELLNVLADSPGPAWGLCLLFGSVLCITGGVGLFRMPDFFSRVHASGVTETLAAPLLLIGLLLQMEWSLDSVKVIMILIIVLATNPTATHAMASPHTLGWGIAQKQTGADRLSLGGAVSANAHGRGLNMKPMIAIIPSISRATGHRVTIPDIDDSGTIYLIGPPVYGPPLIRNSFYGCPAG